MTTITETLSLPHKIDHDQPQILQRHGRHCPGSCLPKPSLVLSTTPTPPGVPHHSVCGIFDPGARVQCRGSCSNLRGSASMHQNHSSKQQFVVHRKSNAGRLDQFGTPSSFDAGISSRKTPRTTRKRKGEYFSAQGIA